MSFIRQVWHGHDYIPDVWDGWIRDRSAKMFVLEVNGRQVGMNRVRFLEDGSAWFEGVRIHPGFRGRGLASMLGENSMKVASERGVTVFRLTSNSRNHQAHRQVARIKFGETARFSIYSPGKGARFSAQKGVRMADAGDLEFVRRTITGSREYGAGSGMMWDSFTAVALTPETIGKRVMEGSVFISEGSVGITKPGREGRDVWRQMCFIGGDPYGAMRIIRHVFGLPGKVDWKLAYLPQGSHLIGTLRRSGFSRSFSMILFERRAKG